MSTSVVIIGAGEFGATTAVSLLRTGKYSVTVIDRAATLPAEDAASTDINKVVRFDYSDEDYSSLAFEAIQKWNQDEWKGIYHQCGCVVVGTGDENSLSDYAKKSMVNVRSRIQVETLSTPDDFDRALNPTRTGVLGRQNGKFGYLNAMGGWTHASAAMLKLYLEIGKLGGRLVPSADFSEFLYTAEKEDVEGVRCKDGRTFRADKVIVATGSWTGNLLGSLMPEDLLVPTAQTVGIIQLEGKEWERYKDVRIVMSRDGSGFYCFPPNQSGQMKFALHRAGYVPDDGIPRTTLTPGADQLLRQRGLSWLPFPSASLLRKKISEFYPGLSTKPMSITRLCYYCDAKDANWVIDYVPQHPSLFIASGGSGHAFKFLPILGDLIRDRFEGTLSKAYTEKWALRARSNVDPARAGMTREDLALDQLASASHPSVAGTLAHRARL